MKALITSACQGPGGVHLEAGEVHELTAEQAAEMRGRITTDKDAIAAAEAAAKAAKEPKK